MEKVWVCNCQSDKVDEEITWWTDNGSIHSGDKFEVGEPKATELFSVERLKQNNLVGIYKIIN